VLEAFREEFGGDGLRLPPQGHRQDPCRQAGEEEGRQADGRRDHAALRLREQLFLLFKFAVKQEWIETNPVEQADEVEHKGEGFYAWTEEDIATFREAYPLGTKPRLAMELILWTGARRGDAHKAAPPKNGGSASRPARRARSRTFPLRRCFSRRSTPCPQSG
jgi:hypothetical protein